VENEEVRPMVAEKIALAEAGGLPAQSSRLKRFNKKIFLTTLAKSRRSD